MLLLLLRSWRDAGSFRPRLQSLGNNVRSEFDPLGPTTFHKPVEDLVINSSLLRPQRVSEEAPEAPHTSFALHSCEIFIFQHWLNNTRLTAAEVNGSIPGPTSADNEWNILSNALFLCSPSPNTSERSRSVQLAHV